MPIDWTNPDSIYQVEPTNHRLIPGGSEYNRYEFVKRHIQPKARVLDVGCNCGQLQANLVQDLGCECVGLDIVPEFIQSCIERKSQYGTFIEMDFSRAHYDEIERLGKFDVVTALELIEHPIDVHGFIDRVLRVLKPDGLLIITTPHPQSEILGYGYMRTHPNHVRMWTPWRLERAFGKLIDYEDLYHDGRLASMGAVFSNG